ncbi:hypothetical protein IAD21_01481 [Abditibacteriota bacterium]|nr:hypothetical protein IAD21_01481 [Abditibacteriota bacterium]
MQSIRSKFSHVKTDGGSPTSVPQWVNLSLRAAIFDWLWYDRRVPGNLTGNLSSLLSSTSYSLSSGLNGFPVAPPGSAVAAG